MNCDNFYGEGMTLCRLVRVTAIGLVGLLAIMGCAAIAASTAETPGERFRGIMDEMARLCVEKKLKPTDSRCSLPKLKPADPLATPEGRFAHSIKIPNPLPEDSGYRPGMTPQEYFEHLCKTEAGEFIYKTVENVEGIYEMRLRTDSPNGANHLYAIEDPYGGPSGSHEPEIWFVGPTLYRFFESPDLARREPEWKRKFTHASYFSLPSAGSTIVRYFGYDRKELRTMQKEYDTVQKSRYGYTWRGITRLHDREFGIAGSELIVLDLQTKEVLAVHRGYAKFEIDERMGVSGFQWQKRCPIPPNMGGGARLPFILKALKPADKSQGK